MKILYRCSDYVVIRKPYGMLSEAPADGADRPSVPNEIRRLTGQEPFTVHRLDATTEGVMVYALNAKAAAALSGEIAAGRFKKTYLAWISADPSLPREGSMTDYLYFDRRAQKSFVVKADKKGAKKASLSYALGEPFFWEGELITPATVHLETGRTHQIRVQFASRRSPLVGDGKYGSRIKRKAPSLWSHTLSFCYKGQEVTYSLPKDESDPLLLL